MKKILSILFVTIYSSIPSQSLANWGGDFTSEATGITYQKNEGSFPFYYSIKASYPTTVQWKVFDEITMLDKPLPTGHASSVCIKLPSAGSVGCDGTSFDIVLNEFPLNHTYRFYLVSAETSYDRFKLQQNLDYGSVYDLIYLNSYVEPEPTILGSGSVNRLSKFITQNSIGNSLFLDDGYNILLTSGNFFFSIGAIIDTIVDGVINFGTTHATTMTFGRSGQSMIINSKVGIGTSNPTSSLDVRGGLIYDSIKSVSNCNSSTSPANCGDAPAGSVAMSVGGNTLTVNTTAVTSNSQILVTEDASLGDRIGVVCNTSTNRSFRVISRVASSNFVIKSNIPPTGSAACLSYWIIN